MPKKQNAFVIMPFSATETCSEKEWTEIFENVIKPALEESGCVCNRALRSFYSVNT